MPSQSSDARHVQPQIKTEQNQIVAVLRSKTPASVRFADKDFFFLPLLHFVNLTKELFNGSVVVTDDGGGGVGLE